jgi:hypothetical protein
VEQAEQGKALWRSLPSRVEKCLARSKEVAAAWGGGGRGGGWATQLAATYRHDTTQRGRPHAPGRAPPRRDLMPRGAAAGSGIPPAVAVAASGLGLSSCAGGTATASLAAARV